MTKKEKINQGHFSDGMLLQILMDNIPDCIYFKDGQSRFIKINKAQAQLLGVKDPEDAIGKTDFDFFTKKHALDALKDEKSIMESQKPIIDKFEKITNAEGKILWVSSTKVPLISPNGKVHGTVGISRDVTDRKHLEDALKRSERKYRKLYEELMNINTIKDILLDVITHDLKNSVGVIKEFSELLNESVSENELVDMIYQASSNLIDVVETVTSLARIGLGEEIHKWDVDLVKIIKNVVKEFSPAICNCKLDLTLDLPEKLKVSANPIIAEIVRNYLNNAIKYGSSGGKIIVRAIKKKKCISVYVIDFGQTIPENMREEIFKRHVQLDKKHAQTGKGLGLAIVKRIADAHNAIVGVKPNKPKGNQFYLQIPIE
ncbi:MAG: PAS domain-containing protein [FCB group bacterium]|nr:PAS domain-containing protein [FCB group bacterium]